MPGMRISVSTMSKRVSWAIAAPARRSRRRRTTAVVREDLGQVVRERAVVVDDEDPKRSSLHLDADRDSRTRRRAAVRPLFALIVPLCFSTIRWHSASPRPVPVERVVNSGRTAAHSTIGDRPRPRSSTVRTRSRSLADHHAARCPDRPGSSGSPGPRSTPGSRPAGETAPGRRRPAAAPRRCEQSATRAAAGPDSAASRTTGPTSVGGAPAAGRGPARSRSEMIVVAQRDLLVDPPQVPGVALVGRHASAQHVHRGLHHRQRVAQLVTDRGRDLADRRQPLGSVTRAM